MVPLEQQFHEQQLKLKYQFGVGRPAAAPAPPHRHEEMAGIATRKMSPRMEMSHVSHGGIGCGGVGGVPPAQRSGGMTR